MALVEFRLAAAGLTVSDIAVLWTTVHSAAFPPKATIVDQM
jgi:hypothetical protein